MNDFIETLAPYAIKHGTASGILPSLIIAQGILETGGGTSELAREANNLFGIKKGTGWAGPVHSVVTSEYRKNAAGEDEIYYITAEFRKYDSYEGAVIDLCAKYTGMPRYAAVPGNFVFPKVAQAVKDAGYATDPIYPSKLIKRYEDYDLGRFDEGFATEIIGEIVSDLEDLVEIIEEDDSMAFRVVIDAGHGRNTPGKRTPAGEREWTFNDVVARACIEELNKYAGVEILRVDDPTGNTDVSLNTRTAKANSWKGSVYVSIHHNANTGRWGTWTGSETFVYTSTVSTDGSWKLANEVHPRLVKAMGLKDRGIKKANFHVLRETRMPAILTEGGYMDSVIDIVAMRNEAKLKAQGVAIAQGIVAYGRLKPKASVASPVKPVSNPNLFRVRKTWADDASQLGAYSDIDGAVAVAKANGGYHVYDHTGKQVYPAIATAPAPTVDKLFRVRKTWEDAASQLGAYADIAGAKELADRNLTHNVFDGTGRLVYDPSAAKAAAEAAERAKAEEAVRLAAEKAYEEARAQYEADFDEAVKLGITDGSDANEAPTRKQVVVMIMRAMRILKG